MKRKQGFTLVELLVVMAIIAILAAIVVPNVQQYITKARMTRALSEINGIELALTAMCSDAGRANVGQLFNFNKVNLALANSMNVDETAVKSLEVRSTQAFFDAATELYTNAIYDLLQMGRNVLREDAASTAANIIDRQFLAKLGENYMDIGNDPWGNRYHIFPGPWRIARNTGGTGSAPIVFRKFTPELKTAANGTVSVSGRKDDYILNREDLAENFSDILEDIETWPDFVGAPADTGKAVYIWSLGENMRSAQMVYMGGYGTDRTTWYSVQEPADIGGGDDINNWDPGATWVRFYS